MSSADAAVPASGERYQDQAERPDQDTEAALLRLLGLAAGMLGAPGAVLAILDRDDVLAWPATGTAGPGTRQSLRAALCRAIAAGDQTLVLDDASGQPTLAAAFAAAGLVARGFACARLDSATGEPLGAVCVLDRERRHWTSAQIGLLRELAGAIADRLELAREHRAHRRRLRLATDAAELGIFAWDLKLDRIVSETERNYTIFGRTRLDAPLTLRAFFDRFLHPEDRSPFEQALAQARRTGIPFRVFGRIRRQDDGRWRWLEFVGSFELGPDGSPRQLVGVIADVTERRTAEQALRESQARLETLLGAVPAILFSLLPDGSCDFLSDEFHKYSGLAATTVDSAGLFQILHPGDVEHARAACDAAIRDREPLDIEYRLRRADGVYRWFKAHATPVPTADGAIAKWIGAALDIEDQKRAREALKDADRRKDQFLAMLAHELRNPLAPLLNAARLLEMVDPADARLKRTSEMIGRQVGHMARLIDDLLDVSRVTQGKILLKKELLELAPLIQHAVDAVRPQLESRRHELQISLPPGPVTIEGDATRLTQVIGNLLDNAAKYTEDGGRIHVLVERVGQDVLVRVRDNGMGISPDLLPHVFELFTQDERSLDRAKGGLGIGLALVRSLVEMHGGEVRAISDGSGRGSEFSMRLTTASSGPAPRAGAPGVPEEERAARRRVLVVDDNADAAESLGMMLALEGHSVETAFDAAESIERARRFRPDVAVLDIGMPGMDGYALAARLRALPETSHTVLIAVTGYGQTEDRVRARRSGFAHHLVKPVEPGRLAALIATLGDSPQP